MTTARQSGILRLVALGLAAMAMSTCGDSRSHSVELHPDHWQRSDLDAFHHAAGLDQLQFQDLMPFLIYSEHAPQGFFDDARFFEHGIREHLGIAPLSHHILIYGLSKAESMQQIGALFGQQIAPGTVGFAYPALNLLCINVQVGFGNVTHEMTHILVHGDFPEDHQPPRWLDEGAATLFESGTWRRDGSFTPDLHSPGIRFSTVKRLGPLPLRRIFTAWPAVVHDDSADPEVNWFYGTAKSFAIFLYQTGRFQPVYAAMREQARHGTMDAILALHWSGLEIDPLEREYHTWLAQQPF